MNSIFQQCGLLLRNNYATDVLGIGYRKGKKKGSNDFFKNFIQIKSIHIMILFLQSMNYQLSRK